MYKPSKPYKQKIIDEIKETWNSPYVKINFNTYPIIQKKFDYKEVDHTDGIGTKGFYHWQQGTFRAAVIDALAMNLNDLAIVGAVPYKLSNHITVPLEDIRILKIVRELVQECKKRKIAIVGGENSFHNNTNGLDISMTVSGFIKNPKPNQFKIGDALIGLKSSGLHSNGITLIREIFKNEYRKEFTVPTRIYIDEILTILSRCKVSGMMHITGGAFTKLKDILGKADALIQHPPKLQPHKIFRDIYKKGVTDKDMYTTFNCGIGYVISAPKTESNKIFSHLKDAAIIGEIVKGNGNVLIRSAFDGKMVQL